jgi:hypothetical protein
VREFKFLNSKGISLVELMITAGLASGIILITLNLSQKVSEEILNSEERADILLDETGVNKILNEDAMSSVPSFGFLKSADKTSAQGDDFWTIWQSDSVIERSLEIDNADECLSMLVVDRSRVLIDGELSIKQTLVASPAYFFNTRKKMTDPVVYSSGKLEDLLSLNHLNVEGQFMKLSAMMPVYALSSMTMGHYQDYGVIVKLKSSKAVVVESVPQYSSPLATSVPTCSHSNTNIETFLRCLPSPGGGTINFYITPVQSINYCFKKTVGRYGFDLYRSVNSVEHLIGSHLASVKLTRLHTSPIINININFCRPGQKDCGS